ncbi:uncharacterized protein [Anabrus simplex]|uniref:uncharacterized protein n=1 Tax=Anabrus simplex TaxID=316456 RepID=UPI0035A34929
MEWNKDITLDLINDIIERPCLWDVSSKEYRDKTKKADSFQELEIMYNCSRECIEKKLASLRSQYSRELQKVQKSRKSWAGADEVYTSKWFAFEAMSRMRGGNVPTKTRTNLLSPEEEDTQSISLEEDDDASAVGTAGEDEATGSRSSPAIALTPIKPPVKRKSENEFLATAIETLKCVKESRMSKLHTANRDECDVFGELVASELKQINDPIVKETLKFNIQKLIYEAKIGQLSGGITYDVQHQHQDE